MSLQTFEDDVLADIRYWAGRAEAFLEAEAEDAWALVKPILTAARPAQLQVLKGFIQSVLVRLRGVTDVATLEAALLNALEAAAAPELTIAQTMGSRILQALIAAVAAL